MLPNEFDYYLILIFLITLAIAMLNSRLTQIVILLFAGYILYISSNDYLVFSLAFVTILTYYCAKFNNKALLAVALIGSLG
jgi:hypothetical protein